MIQNRIFFQVFCERRHKFIPRKELTAFKRQLVLKRREKVAQEKRSKLKRGSKPEPEHAAVLNENLNGDGPLINYTNEKRFTMRYRLKKSKFENLLLT